MIVSKIIAIRLAVMYGHRPVKLLKNPDILLGLSHFSGFLTAWQIYKNTGHYEDRTNPEYSSCLFMEQKCSHNSPSLHNLSCFPNLLSQPAYQENHFPNPGNQPKIISDIIY